MEEYTRVLRSVWSIVSELETIFFGEEKIMNLLKEVRESHLQDIEVMELNMKKLKESYDER